MSELQLENSTQQLKYVHPARVCAGRPCVIHNKTDHPLRAWPQHFNFALGYMERYCEHALGHPDPDEYKAVGSHPCDGCCGQAPREVPDALKPLQETMARIQQLTAEGQAVSAQVAALFARGETSSEAFGEAMVRFYELKTALEAQLQEFTRLTS